MLLPGILSAQKIIDITDFGITPNGRNSVTSLVRTALEACRGEESAVLKFPAGRYDFWYNGTLPDSVKQSGIEIDGLKNLTIDGNGSEFVFHGRMFAMDVKNCENLTLRNFSIDWERPLTSQATVRDITDEYLDINIEHLKYPYIIEDNKLRFTGEGWKTPVVHYILFDKDSKDVVTLTRDGALGNIFNANAEEISPGHVRLYGRLRYKPAKGTYIALYAQRELSGISLYKCKNTLLEDVKVYYAPGGGIFSFMCDDLHFNRVNVIPNESKGRIFSSMADATYFPNCKGLVKIENCMHAGMADDWANFRGTYTHVQKTVDANTVQITCKHTWDDPAKYYNAGDEICFVQVASMQREKERFVIKDVRTVGNKEVRLTLDNKIPSYIRSDYVVENMTWTPEVEVTNCVIPRMNRARGILLTTPRRAVFENNLFRTAGAAILVEGDTDVWYEAGGVCDFTIRNNTFENCMTSAEPGDWKWGEAIICITPSHKPKTAGEEPYHRNIRIENNTFKYYDYNLLYARSVKGLTFKGNRIEYTNDYPPHGRPVNFYLDGCTDVNIGGNIYDAAYPPRKAELHHMKKSDLKTDKGEKISIEVK